MSLVEVCRVSRRRRADHVSLLLQSEGLETQIESAILPDAEGARQRFWLVLVPVAQAMRARQIVAEDQTEDGEDGAPGSPAGASRTVAPASRALRRGSPFYWVAALIVANVAVWIAMEGRGGSENSTTLLRFGAAQAAHLRQGEWWRLFTAVFLHIGFQHLLANMCVLAVLGPSVLSEWSLGRFYFMYIYSGVLGNVVSFIGDGGPALKAGASGAILGLLGVLGGSRLRQIWRPPPLAQRSKYKAWHILAMIVAFYGFVVGTGPADHYAHIGGIAAGLIMALALPRPASPRADRLLDAILFAISVSVPAVAGILAYQAR